MAEWGNATGQPYQQDMDSRGQRLRVRNTTGADTESDWRAEIAEEAVFPTLDKALLIVGRIGIAQGPDRNYSGTIRPYGSSAQTASLGINIDEGFDPDVWIGWNNASQGNRVYLNAKETAIGPGQGPQTGFAVTMKSPVKMPGVTGLDADLEVEGTVQTRRVDALSFGTVHILGVGCANASTVEIGKTRESETIPEIPTHVMGSLKVVQDTDLQGTVLIRGNLTTQSPVELRNNTTVLGNLVVSDSASATNVNVSNTITARNLAAQGTVSGTDVNATGAVTATRIVAGNAAILMDEQCRALVPTLIRTERDEPALTVEHLHGDRQAALHVINESTFEEATGGYFRTTIALVAEGQVRINGRAVLNGETVHLSPVFMQGKPIFMGGEGDEEVKMVSGGKRLEFYIGDKLKFYIDETGGHNA